MGYLRVRELAEEQGLTLAIIQREAKLPVSTARRYWWSSRTGLQRDSGTLNEVNLITLKMIAEILRVRPGDLLAEINMQHCIPDEVDHVILFYHDSERSAMGSYSSRSNLVSRRAGQFPLSY